MIGVLEFFLSFNFTNIQSTQAHRPLPPYQLVLIRIFKMFVPIPRPNKPSFGCEKHVPGTCFHVFDGTQSTSSNYRDGIGTTLRRWSCPKDSIPYPGMRSISLATARCFPFGFYVHRDSWRFVSSALSCFYLLIPLFKLPRRTQSDTRRNFTSPSVSSTTPADSPSGRQQTRRHFHYNCRIRITLHPRVYRRPHPPLPQCAVSEPRIPR